MAKRVLFSGYFGFGNTGDEAILEALCQEVRRQRADVDIAVLLDNQDLAERLGVEAYPRRQHREIVKALRKSDLLISGGGGLLQDVTGLGSVVYYLGIVALARTCRVPVAVMCQGFGPVRHPLSKCLVRRLLPLANYASWRDESSVEEVHRLAPRLRSELSADPALLLDPVSPKEVAEIRRANGLQRDYVVVAMRSWRGLYVENFVYTLSVMLEENPELELALLPFQPSQDRQLAHDLAQRLGRFAERVHVVADLLPRQILGLVDEAQMVVAMRLHALIFAASRNVPYVGIAYDPKVASFCERSGAPFVYLDKLVNKELELTWRDAASHRQELCEKVASSVEPMRESARRAICEALRLLD